MGRILQPNFLPNRLWIRHKSFFSEDNDGIFFVRQDAAHYQSVRRRMFFDRKNLCRIYALYVVGGINDVFHLEAAGNQFIRKFFGRNVYIYEILEPFDRNYHNLSYLN